MKEDITGKFTDTEIAEAFVLPVKLTQKQRHEAALQLAEARKKSMAEMSEADILTGNLLQLKFQLENYIKSDKFDELKTFGYFLKQYLQIINKKRNEFAWEIDVHETLLSQLINDHREPGENIIIRLELHCNNLIPAAYWYRLIEKQKEHFIQTNTELRKREKKFVKRQLKLSY